MYLNLWLPHITSFHTVTLPCSLCRICVLRYFQFAAIFPPSQSLPVSFFNMQPPPPACSPREPCSVPSFPWRTRMNTKHEVGSPWHFIVVWHFPLYLPQDVTYVCTQGQESFKKGKERRGENGGRGGKDQKGDKNSYFCLGQSFRQ